MTDERQAGPTREAWAANGLAALDHLDTLFYAGEPGGMAVADYRTATDAIRSALVAQLPAQEKPLDVERLARALEASGIEGDSEHMADYIAAEYRALTPEPHDGEPT